MVHAQSGFDMTEIEPAILKAEHSFHKLALLVGKPGAGKTTQLRHISQTMHIPLINLGLSLSERLLSLTVRQRKLKASDIIEDILEEPNSARVGVDNTEIIFEPSLKLNVLGLLKKISRNRLVIWTWNGEAKGDSLTYGYPGHPEYERISAKEFTVFVL